MLSFPFCSLNCDKKPEIFLGFFAFIKYLFIFVKHKTKPVMTQFKGTKGKWSLDTTPEKYSLKHVVFDDNQFAVVQGKDRDANALLISKAPEMLERLEQLYDMLRQGALPNPNEIAEIKQLIKEATEL